MKCLTHTIRIQTQKGPEFIDITDEIQGVIERATVKHGFAVIYCRHTTAAIRINENEPFLLKDMEAFLQRVAPPNGPYSHNDMHHIHTPDDGANGHAHCQQLLLGASETVPIVDSKMLFGQWQRVFLVELDRGRPREVIVHLVGE